MNIVRNLSAASFGQIIGRLLYLVSIVLQARILGTSLFGTFIEAFAFVALFSNLMDFGLSSIAVRDLVRLSSRDEIAATLRDLLVGKIPLILVSLTVTLLVGLAIFVSPEMRWLIVILSFGFVASSYQALFNGVYYALNKPEMPSWFLLLQRTLYLLLGTIAVWYWRNPMVLAISYTGCVLIVLAITIWQMIYESDMKLVGLKTPINWGLVRSFLRQGTNLTLLGLATSAYVRVDHVLLGRIAGNDAVGIYGAAYRFLDGLLVMGLVYRIAVFPVASKLNYGNRDALTRLTSETLRIAILLIVPVSVVTYKIAPFIVDTLLGSGYSESGPILSILVLSSPFSIANNALLFILIALRWDKTATGIALAAVAVNVGMNLWMIPKLGAVGPAYVTVLTETLMFGGLVGYLWKSNLIRSAEFLTPKLWIAVFLPLIVGAIAGLVNLWFALVGYIGFYVIAVFWLKILNPIELNLLRRLIHFMNNSLRNPKSIVSLVFRD